DRPGPLEARLPHGPQALHRARPRQDEQPTARGPGQGPCGRRYLMTPTYLAGMGVSNDIQTSGGTSGRPGTGLRSSVHASPAPAAGSVVVIGGAPGIGKTTFAVHHAH